MAFILKGPYANLHGVGTTQVASPVQRAALAHGNVVALKPVVGVAVKGLATLSTHAAANSTAKAAANPKAAAAAKPVATKPVTAAKHGTQSLSTTTVICCVVGFWVAWKMLN
jgi:hypothetical protein